jgi:transcriptional regulator with XRE-family HTH domain
MKLRERLASLRRQRGLTLREVSDRVQALTGEKVSLPWLSELEHHDKLPSLEVLIRLARVYDLSVQALLAPVYFEDGTPQQIRLAAIAGAPVPLSLEAVVHEAVSESLSSATALDDKTRSALAEAIASGVRAGLVCWLEESPRRVERQPSLSA